MLFLGGPKHGEDVVTVNGTQEFRIQVVDARDQSEDVAAYRTITYRPMVFAWGGHRRTAMVVDGMSFVQAADMLRSYLLARWVREGGTP